MAKPDYDTSVAHMAGNIAAGLVTQDFTPEYVAKVSVQIARRIVAEIKRTEPAKEVPENG